MDILSDHLLQRPHRPNVAVVQVCWIWRVSNGCLANSHISRNSTEVSRERSLMTCPARNVNKQPATRHHDELSTDMISDISFHELIEVLVGKELNFTEASPYA